MSDPLGDQRAALAASFRAAAWESQSTAAGLAAAQHDATWTGRAAAAFHRAIGRLPSELERVRAGFGAVADALVGYEPELARIRAAFVRTIACLGDVECRLASARVAADTGDGAYWLVDELQLEVRRLQRLAFELLDEFSSARDACRAAIAAAGNTALRSPQSGQGTTVI